MRYPKNHKETSRQKVVTAAARRFRARGIAATGIEEVMRGAGLTKGAFSAHFGSKEDLVRAALHESATRCPLFSEGFKTDSLEGLVAHYLQAGHRDHPELGCPAAALASEIAREDKGVRAAFVEDMEKLLTFIEAHLPKGGTAAARRAKALAVFSTMMGTLQLARLVPDEKLSQRILKSGRKAALGIASS